MILFPKNVLMGSHWITIYGAGENLHEAIMETKKLSFYEFPNCGCCGSDKLYMTAYTTKENYKYVKVACRDCKAQLTFGQPKKEPDTFYPRKREDKSYDWKPYEGKDTPKPAKENPPTEIPVAEPTDEDELPF